MGFAPGQISCLNKLSGLVVTSRAHVETDLEYTIALCNPSRAKSSNHNTPNDLSSHRDGHWDCNRHCLIMGLRVNAFIALITAAIVVSLMAVDVIPLPAVFRWHLLRSHGGDEFGTSCGKIAIVIALAAVIGTCMMDSGAADRIVRAFMNLLGIKRAPWALMGSGYLLAIPVFFDTVFYLLVPLARSFQKRTGAAISSASSPLLLEGLLHTLWFHRLPVR